MLPTLIDFIIVVLLIGTLVYAYLLDRRVRTLMLALREMEPMVGAFSSAVDQSARSIEDLSVAPRRAEPPLQRRRGAAPADEPRPTQKTTAASPDPKGPVRGQTSVPGKSDLVRTFFDITKERQK